MPLLTEWQPPQAIDCRKLPNLSHPRQSLAEYTAYSKSMKYTPETGFLYRARLWYWFCWRNPVDRDLHLHGICCKKYRASCPYRFLCQFSKGRCWKSNVSPCKMDKLGYTSLSDLAELTSSPPWTTGIPKPHNLGFCFLALAWTDLLCWGLTLTPQTLHRKRKRPKCFYSR